MARVKPTAAGSMSAPDRWSRRRAAWARSASSLRPETSHGTVEQARASARAGRDGRGASSMITWALVPLTPNEETPARRGRSPAVQACASWSSSTRPAVQSISDEGRSACRVLGSRSCWRASTILMTPADACGGLGVADVRLRRAQHGRFVAVLAVGGEQGLGLDRVAQAGAGAVRLHGVDLGAVSRALARAWRMTRCCEGPLGAVRPLDAPSWLTAEPRTTARTGWPLRSASGQPLQEQHARALAPAGAVGVVGEGLAAAVLGEAALLAEADERARRRHDGDAAGQGERALALAERLDREVQGDQRRRSRPCRR